ncbi:MAG: class I SAM-dependent methyltransferase [Fimbriimonadaceae bacterium]|nr:class I SAM-dependent methyltransferase [Chitinophagales bacterium]
MTENSQWFRHWFDSAHYHKLYNKRNDKEAADFVEHLLSHLHPAKQSSMLDIGCGNGRHSKYLASKGFNTTGFDLSLSSIREAKKNETERLHFFQHDMRLSFGKNKFDYAFNFFTSFGYFQQNEHVTVIKNISGSLKQGGTFVLDYLNVQYAEGNIIPSEEKEIDGIIYSISRWVDEKYFYKKILISGDQMAAPLEYVEQVARFNKKDFEALFLQHDLQIEETYGDYELNTYYVKTSPRLILIAKKM